MDWCRPGTGYRQSGGERARGVAGALSSSNTTLRIRLAPTATRHPLWCWSDSHKKGGVARGLPSWPRVRPARAER